MAAVLVGIVAGFSAFMLQKKAADPARNRPVIVAAAALAAAYLALTILVLAAQSSHTWDAGDALVHGLAPQRTLKSPDSITSSIAISGLRTFWQSFRHWR